MAYKLADLIPAPKRFSLSSQPMAAFASPKASQSVGLLFALSAEIEHSKSMIAIRLLQGEPRAAMEMLSSLRSAKAAAVGAVIDSKMSKHHAKLFGRILKTGADFEDHRNKFAHWLWATCYELPDHLCLIDPRTAASCEVNFIERRAREFESLSRGVIAPWESVSARNTEAYRETTLVYDKTDRMDLMERGSRMLSCYSTYYRAISATYERYKVFAQLEAQLRKLGC